MKKRRIIYTVDVDFPDHVHEETTILWADGIARGIEHNKPEVKAIEYDVQVRDLPEQEYLHQTEHYEEQGVPPDAPETERAERERLQLPPADEDDG